MDSILADEPSVHTLPDSAESDSAPSAAPAEATAPEAQVAKAEPPAEQADEESDEGPVPVDVEGFKKALAAARGDKRKARKQWQEAERKLAMMEGELRALRQQPARSHPAQEPQAEPKADLDEEFYTSGPGKFWETREQQLERRFTERLIDADRRAMRRALQDYDEAEAAFLAAAQANPGLAAAMRASDDPVGFAYERGKEIIKFQELGATSYDDLEAKIRAKVEAEYAAKSHGESTTAAPVKPHIPKSNASARGSGVGSRQAWSGPRPLDDLFS